MDCAHPISTDVLETERLACEKRLQIEAADSMLGPHRRRRPRAGQYPTKYSPYLMSEKPRVLQLERKVIHGDIKALREFMQINFSSTYFVEDHNAGLNADVPTKDLWCVRRRNERTAQQRRTALSSEIGGQENGAVRVRHSAGLKSCKGKAAGEDPFQGKRGQVSFEIHYCATLSLSPTSSWRNNL